MQLTIRHTLTFTLGAPSRAVLHLLLTALPTPQQKIERWSIEMPGFANAASFRDAFGNKAHLVSLAKPAPEITVTVTGSAETVDKAGILGRFDHEPMPALFRRTTALTPADPELIEGLDPQSRRIAMLHELMDRIHVGLADQAQSQTQDGQSQAQSQSAGATPDQAVHAFIGAARALDIPARYVTGYLAGDDDSSLHAWAEAWDDGLGWIGFDPVLNLCPITHHLRLASGLDAMSTMPIRAVPVWPEMPVETVDIEVS